MSALLKKYSPILFLSFGIAAFAWLIHNLKANPHTDLQLVTYTFQYFKAFMDGTLIDELLSPHKYPLFPSIILGILYVLTIGLLFLSGRVSSLSDLEMYLFTGPQEIHFISRLLVFGSAVLSLYLLYKISQKIYPKTSSLYAVFLLSASPLFLVFMTAIRPHMLLISMTLLTVFTSILFHENKTRRHELCAFGSFVLAAATLQNGFLALIFPVWGYLSSPRTGIQWKHIFQPRLIALVGSALALSVIVGYPFALRSFIEGSANLQPGVFGMAYFDGALFQGGGFSALLTLLFGSEIVLTLFFLLSIVHFAGKKTDLHPALLVILAYLAIYLLFFGLLSGAVMRFFFPILPFMALLGGLALSRVASSLRALFLMVVLLIHVKFVFLGMQPDTYQLTKDFILSHTHGTVTSFIPHYFLDIPPTQKSIKTPTMAREHFILRLLDDLPSSRDYVPLERIEESNVVVGRERDIPPAIANTWEMCFRAGSSKGSQDGLLWSDSDTDWLLLTLWKVRHLGPTLLVYCRRDSLSQDKHLMTLSYLLPTVREL